MLAVIRITNMRWMWSSGLCCCDQDMDALNECVRFLTCDEDGDARVADEDGVDGGSESLVRRQAVTVDRRLESHTAIVRIHALDRRQPAPDADVVPLLLS